MHKTVKRHRVLILTQSVFSGNYGAVLQAFALQKTLRDMGHEVYTDATNDTDIYKQTLAQLKNIAKRVLNILLGRQYDLSPTQRDRRIITENILPFISEKIDTAHIANYSKQTGDYTAFVVGSDQVWRRAYANISRNFLDFAANRDVIRISYAASFGKDSINEYGKALTAKSKSLAGKFDGISVRENTGIAICRRSLEVDAEQHIDPTLLISRDVYVKIANHGNGDAELFTYVLDESPEKRLIIQKVIDTLGYTETTGKAKKYAGHRALTTNPSRYTLRSIEDWLRGFMQAKYIVTDSFHGCVFSIIFNKPFIAIGNKNRGLTRFTSLLTVFNLLERLVMTADEVTKELIDKPIDWNKVNAKIKSEQKRSFEYLRKHLG